MNFARAIKIVIRLYLTDLCTQCCSYFSIRLSYPRNLDPRIFSTHHKTPVYPNVSLIPHTKDLKKPYPINVGSKWHLAQSEPGLFILFFWGHNEYKIVFLFGVQASILFTLTRKLNMKICISHFIFMLVVSLVRITD